MRTKARTPFDGGPVTHHGRDAEGVPQTTVIAAAVGPWRAKLFDGLSLTSAIGITALTVYEIALAGGASTAGLLGTLALPFATHFGLKHALRLACPNRVPIVFTPERLSFRRFWGWRHFDRSIPHRFALIPHDRTEREKLWLEFVERKFRHKWWCWSRRRYFGESYHLIYEYQGQRNDILSIHRHRKAVALLARLQACDQEIEAKARTGRGVAHDPADEWSRQPGGELA